MPEFHFTGTVTLKGVDFYIYADSEDEARKKASAGVYETREYDGAEATDCTVDAATCRLNE